MKKLVISFLILSGVAIAANRNEDLKVILEKSYLNSQCESLLNMMALEAISGTQKKIDAEKLIAQFRKEFTNEKTLAKFVEPYGGFSDEEVCELRKIYENPVWQKFNRDGMTLIQSHMQAIRDTFKTLAERFQADVRTVTEILQVTKENYGELVKLEKPVILDVAASWCTPCKSMEPVLDELCEEFQESIQFAKLDFDAQKELANELGVTSLPTFLFFKPGSKTPSIKAVGFISKKDFETKINELLRNSSE